MEKIRALIEGVTQDLIVFLAEDNSLSVEQAMDKVYNSTLFEKLSDSETGLYRESSAYCYSILKDELAKGEFAQYEV